jgi:enterochelin esterase-like enzyme
VLALLVLVTILAGCGRERPAAAKPITATTTVAGSLTPSRQPSPTLTPSPSPAPLPSATPLPAPSAAATESSTPVPTPCSENGRVVGGTYPSPTAGAAQDFRIYLPPCYAADRHVYPTLYLFAGNIHDESKWDELGVDEAADAAIATGEVAPLLIVMADGGWLANNTSGGPGSFESVVLEDLIPYVENSYCAWAEPAGRAIGGLSRGGYWALEIAFRHPQLFSSVGGHSAALLDTYAGPAVNPQQTALDNDLGTLRIYLDIGADDYLRANTVTLHQEMAAHGVPHTWHFNEGRHEDAYWAAHAADYLRWYAAPWSRARADYPSCA